MRSIFCRFPVQTCLYPLPAGLETTADTAAELGPDTVQRIVDKLGSRKTAGLAKKLGGDQTGQLVTDMGPGVTSDVVQEFGPDLTADIVMVRRVSGVEHNAVEGIHLVQFTCHASC